MKNLIVLVLLLGLFGCSDDSPTAPIKEYPISHLDIAEEFIIKFNEKRRVRGLQEYVYIDDIDITIEGENVSFVEVTSQKEDDYFLIEYWTAFEKSDTLGRFVFRDRYYFDSDKNLIDDLIEMSKYKIEATNEGEYKPRKVSLNIVERENKIVKPDDREYDYRVGKVQVDIYWYLEIYADHEI